MTPQNPHIIASLWEGYRANVIPKDAPLIQLREGRLCFYAGAISLFTAIMTLLDPGSEATDADLLKMAWIEEELDAFGKTAGGEINVQ